jgi:O-antigen/teichoic acid export membrane protein
MVPMGLVRNVAKNALAMGSVQVASQVSTFILSIFLQFYIKDEYGFYSYAFALSSLIFILADFGLGFQMVVEVAPNKELAPQYLTNTLYLRAILGVLAMGITLGVVLLSGLPPVIGLAIMIIALSTAFNWIALTFTSMLTAFERMHYVLYTNLIERIFTVSLAIGLLVLGFGLIAIVLVVLAGSLLNVTLSLLITSRYIIRPARRPDRHKAREQLRTAIPYATTGIMITSLYSVNAVLVMNLALWSGTDPITAAHSTAIYNLAFNLVIALTAVPTILITALLPVISRLYKTSTDLTRLTQQKVMKYMFALGLPVTVGGMILGDRIIQLIYAPTFWDSAQVFKIMIPVIAVTYFGTGIGSVLASANRIRFNTLAATLGALVNAGLCFVLIPFFGAAGAAVAFTLSYLIITCVGLYLLSRYVFKVNLVDILLKPLIAASGMGLVLLLIPSVSLIPSVLIGTVAYFVIFFGIGALDKQDKEILVKILKKEA